MPTYRLAEMEIWLERYAEILECDDEPSCIAVAILNLVEQNNRAKKRIIELQKQVTCLNNSEKLK